MNGDWDRLHGQHLRGMGEGAGWPASDEAEAREGTRKMEDHSSSSGEHHALKSHVFCLILFPLFLVLSW